MGGTGTRIKQIRNAHKIIVRKHKRKIPSLRELDADRSVTIKLVFKKN
jgi:hypothetical protein